MRARNPRVAIVLLASRYAPYDPNRGREAGADDYIDKPFDTQSLIEKVKKAMTAREMPRAAAPAPMPAPAAAAGSPTATAPMAAPGFSSTQRMQPPAALAGAPGVAGGVGLGKASFPTQRTHTLSFEGAPAAPPAAQPPPAPLPITRTAPSGMPVVHAPAPAPPTAPPSPGASAHTVPTAAPPRTGGGETAAPAATNGHLAGKLGDLGLTAAQAEAVLALSRELVERVVWEVVPQLAETIIKEEIARLTRDR
jgi:hypothetical protein